LRRQLQQVPRARHRWHLPRPPHAPSGPWSSVE
jgi:hypothetical protein